MLYFVIIVSVILAGFFIWASIDSRRQKKIQEKNKDKKHFRTEEDQEEYGKKLKDGEESVVDFNDAD